MAQELMFNYLQVVTPLTSLSLTGRRLMGDYENGIHRYSVNGEKDGKAVRAELDINARDLSMDLKAFCPEGILITVFEFSQINNYMHRTVELFICFRQHISLVLQVHEPINNPDGGLSY